MLTYSEIHLILEGIFTIKLIWIRVQEFMHQFCYIAQISICYTLAKVKQLETDYWLLIG